MESPRTTMAKPTFSLREDDLVTLLVGPEEEKFVVHESCIARYSDFFKTALKKEWIEGQTRVVKLPEEPCVEFFISYINFAYRGKLPTDGLEIMADDGFIDEPYLELAKFYAMGERMLDDYLLLAVPEEILRLAKIESPHGYRCFPDAACIAFIYDETSSRSTLRRLMVDFYASEGEAH